MSDANESRKAKRAVLWVIVGTLALAVVAFLDMAWGTQALSPWLQAEGEPGVSYYEDSQLRIGNWRLTNGQRKEETLGIAVIITKQGNKLPVLETREWDRQGNLIAEAEAFAANGAPMAFYPESTDITRTDKLSPFPLLVYRKYEATGSVISETRYRFGRLESEASPSSTK